MELSDAGEQAAQRLAGALEGPDGPRYHGVVLDDVLAILVLSTAPLDALDPIEEGILAAFHARAGLASSTGADVAQKIGRYFASHPLPEALASEMQKALTGLLSSSTNTEQVAAALGAARSSSVPVNQREGAAGSARMGVMGRFAFKDKK